MNWLKSRVKLSRIITKKIHRLYTKIFPAFTISWNTHTLSRSILSVFVLWVFGLYITSQSWKLPSIATADYLEVKSVDDWYIPLDNVVMGGDQDSAWRFKYIVKPGDTLISIAQEFGVTTKEITRSNNLSSSKITPWQELVISEVDGIVYELPDDIPLKTFIAKYWLNSDDVKQLNFLQNDNDLLKKGQQLFLPLTMEEAQNAGLIEKDTVAEPIRPQRPPASVRPNKPTTATTTTTIKNNNAGSMRRYVKRVTNWFWFAPWHCTRYAAQKRPDIFTPWKVRPFGWNWRARWVNARNAWFSVGKTPKVWAVAVMPIGRWWYGHVGIVVDIDDDGAVLLESMNYRWRYIVSRDWISTSSISSYIY